jgi:hypothetical protein
MLPIRSEAPKMQAQTASERSKAGFQGFEDFYLKAKARIWP